MNGTKYLQITVGLQGYRRRKENNCKTPSRTALCISGCSEAAGAPGRSDGTCPADDEGDEAGSKAGSQDEVGAGLASAALDEDDARKSKTKPGKPKKKC